ncbi:hypothetical protein KFL_000620120 [Klebsormidium nitens]|uniref:BTB domain-containing protein n=1 Tax=Klebsormidium nitens TaxID=105231 RepID=A0A1Y1HY55_KLENI|nr:hypothetical protein KFL_000620120 [Klebsormidium nitens]|eukprot:GAQ80778.1 hypothetical protein KFL_000620120 [Klebsormidium nitens]
MAVKQEVLRRPLVAKRATLPELPESLRRFWTDTFEQRFLLDYEISVPSKLISENKPFRAILVASPEVAGQRLPFAGEKFVGLVEIAGVQSRHSHVINVLGAGNKRVVPACDGLQDLTVGMAWIDVSNTTIDGQEAPGQRRSGKLESDAVAERFRFFQGKGPLTSHVTVFVSVLLQRTYLECERSRVRIQRTPEWKLLKEVERSGDAFFRGTDGSTIFAHSSVLASASSHFRAVLDKRPKLIGRSILGLPLPVSADGDTIRAFLKCLYGVPVLLLALEYRRPTLERLYRLADACGARGHCLEISDCLGVSENDLADR